jgi:small-conductance mechanosensitive channel
MSWISRHTLRVAFVGLSLLGAGAYGADAPAPAEAKPAAPEIQPIAPAEIPIRADADERFVQDVMSRARQPDPAAKLVAPLDELTAGISKLSQTFKRDELKSLPAIRLESLDRHWDFYLVQLKAWRSDLQAITARYSDDAAELAKRRAVWEATRTAALGSGLAPALDERIGQVLAEIDAAEKALSTSLDSQLRLAQRGNTVQQAAEAGKKAVTSAIAYFDRRLFIVDAPPLWQAWTDRTPSQKGVDTMLVGLAIERDFLAEYNARYDTRLWVLNIAALLLLPLMFWLSARSRRLVSDDADLKSSAQVLLRPISAWLVLVLVGVLFFEPDAPMIRHETALLLALVPILRLIPSAAYRALGPWPYILTALYLLDELGFLLVGSPLLHRLHTFAIGTLTLGAILWLLLRSKGRATPEDQTAQSTFVRTMAWLAAAAIVVALIANLLGNTSLAEVLTSGVLDSGYVALAFYAIALVLGAMMKLLLARRGMTRFRVVTQHAGPLLKSTGRLLNAAAFVAWLFVMLNEFRVYRPVEAFVTTVLTHPLEAGKISVTLGGVLLFVASVWTAFWLARTIRVVLRDDVLPNMDLPRGVGNSISTLTYYAVMTLGVMVALAAAGFQVSQLAFIVGALGVGIGFGLQNVVNNFVSGLILMFERPIQPGDVVEVSGTSGKVREIGMRATTLSTFEGADVVVPNGMLLNEKLINWTLSDMDRRIDVNVGVAYGTDPNRVLQLLMDVTRSTDGIADRPEPTVLFAGFGANSLDFSIRSWTNNFDEWVKIRSALTVRVHDALKDAGIEIPFPQHDLHLRSVSPGAGAALAGLNKAPVPPTAG